MRNLHALRGIAAFCVVFYHLDIPLPNGVHTDFNAVAVFFVISGYLMRLTSQRDRRLFITKRVLRVIPTLWVVTFLVVLFEGTGLMNPPYTYPLLFRLGIPFLSNNFSSFINENWANIIRSFLLFPRTESFTPIIGVAWTLSIEMLCYAVFGLCLICFKASGAIVANVVIALFYLFLSQWGLRFLTSYMPFFCVGLGISYLKHWVEIEARALPVPVSIAIILLLITIYTFIQTTSAILYLSETRSLIVFLTYLLVIALPVVVTMIADAVGLAVFRPLMVLGDISFSLYLVHTTVIETFRPVWAIYPMLAPTTLTGSSLLTIACVLAGVVVYRLVEKPLTRLQHHLVRRSITV